MGVALAAVILGLTGHYTGTEGSPTRRVAATTRTGAATVILSGFGLGLESAALTAGVIGVGIVACFLLAGGTTWLALFLIALAGCGAEVATTAVTTTKLQAEQAQQAAAQAEQIKAGLTQATQAAEARTSAVDGQ